MTQHQSRQRDVLIIGGGQAGPAVGYFLRRSGLSFSILDGEDGPGGAWTHAWSSLTLFSPAQWSSLPGWPMPAGDHVYPQREEVVAYLSQYEERYQLPVERPVQVTAVHSTPDHLSVETDRGEWTARAVVSATGTWRAPFIPDYPNQALFGERSPFR